MDNLEFLDGSPEPNAEATPAAAEAPAEAAPQETPQESSEAKEDKPARGPDGKFAKKEEPIMVPLQALHETRDEVKALKTQLEALKPVEPQGQTPDIFENPEAYTAHVQNLIVNERLNLSEEMARQSAGDEVVNAAQEWGKQQFASNPAFAQAFYSQRNPYGFLVQQYQRQTLVSQLGDDPKQIEAFLAWRATQQPAQAEPQPSPTPPKSIASALSAGGVQHSATGPGVAFGEFIK